LSPSDDARGAFAPQTRSIAMARLAFALVLACMTTSCLAAAAVGAAGDIVGGTISATGAVVGAGVDAVAGDDDEDNDRGA
jgi:hypothetical protein